MKDDPFLMEELDEIYKRRRQDLVGDREADPLGIL